MNLTDHQNRQRELTVLHERINQCRKCESLVENFVKPLSMNRGDAGRIMIVGQAPGRSEISVQAAFSGPAGTRLNKWLIASGARAEAPRRGIYLTSIAKCRGNDFSVMARECRPHLHEQIRTLMPDLIITLGKPAYEAITFSILSYDKALFQIFNSEQFVLVTPSGAHFSLLVWPHPSGLNRKLNEAVNQAKLAESCRHLQPFMQRAQQ